uniref:Uncharacterized protein n=1 Tax=viral metagenome TaxID=1070528 RepID=A0A6M3XUC3_9ZZZZ
MATDSRELEERALKAYQEAEARMKEAYSSAWKELGVFLDNALEEARQTWRAIQAEIDKAREEGVIKPTEEVPIDREPVEDAGKADSEAPGPQPKPPARPKGARHPRGVASSGSEGQARRPGVDLPDAPEGEGARGKGEAGAGGDNLPFMDTGPGDPDA